MPKCTICGKTVPQDGWGATAQRNDGGGYTHLRCLPKRSPAPTPAAPGRPHSPATAVRGAQLPPSEYLTLTAAAHLLGIHKATLRRRIKKGTLPAFRLAHGQTILIERTALTAILELL